MKRILSSLLILACILPLASCSAGLTVETENSQTRRTDGEEVNKKTEAKTEEKREDPKEDGKLRIFFVSNSTCYYFTDELYGLLTAAGYEDVRLCLAYYSGCSLEKHYNWLLENKAEYQYRVVDKNGVSTYANVSLNQALAKENWDLISFDNNARSFSSGDVETSLGNAKPYFEKLYQYIQNKFPHARYYWHQVWANEIGYHLAFEMKTREQRTQIFKAKQGVMHRIMEEYGVGGIPTGDAWEKVRDLPLFTKPLPQFPEVDHFTLCSRLVKGEFKDDFTHDGDIGGGQYLNACVWFEVITGQSCVGNPFRPAYTLNGEDLSLTEEKIAVLQKAAHEAVEEFKSRLA